MHLRSLLTLLLNKLWREPKLARKHLTRESCSEAKKNRYVFMADGIVPHGGLFDRFKGAITIYALAKAQGKDFKIAFSDPFRLEDYLQPNHYNWSLGHETLSRQWHAVKVVFGYGEQLLPFRLLKNRKKETHFYYGYNNLADINARYHTHYDWGELYDELFKPTPTLQAYIDKYQKEIGNDYIAVHLRFRNFLGDAVETTDINPVLPPEAQETLKSSCMQTLTRIWQEAKAKHGESTRILLASDSMHFIEYAKALIPEIYVIPGTVKHIDTAAKVDNMENVKLFLDYHLIARAKAVYNIVGEGMWPSAFSEYPAKIGRTSFERLFI